MRLPKDKEQGAQMITEGEKHVAGIAPGTR